MSATLGEQRGDLGVDVDPGELGPRRDPGEGLDQELGDPSARREQGGEAVGRERDADGVASRGLIFLLIGAFMVVAAYHADPHQAKGVGRALRFIQSQWEGRYLLAAVSLGLIAYGAFQCVLARYRRVDPT